MNSRNGSISLNDILVTFEFSAEDLDFIENQKGIENPDAVENENATVNHKQESNEHEASIPSQDSIEHEDSTPSQDSIETEDSTRSIGRQSISLLRRYDGEISDLRERRENARHERSWIKTAVPPLTALVAISVLVMATIKPHKSAFTPQIEAHAHTPVDTRKSNQTNSNPAVLMQKPILANKR